MDRYKSGVLCSEYKRGRTRKAFRNLRFSRIPLSHIDISKRHPEWNRSMQLLMFNGSFDVTRCDVWGAVYAHRPGCQKNSRLHSKPLISKLSKASKPWNYIRCRQCKRCHVASWFEPARQYANRLPQVVELHAIPVQ